MNRRTFIRTTGACAAALSFAHCDIKPHAKPNVIYILADDLGWGDLSCYGQKVLKTPALDRMAEEGMRFSDHYAGSTVCAPSRCVLLTGLHTGHAPIRGNDPVTLTGREITIAKIMKEAGYQTACIGKWGIGQPPPPDDPNKAGFDMFFGYVNMFHAHNFYPEFLIRNGEKTALNNVMTDARQFEPGREGYGVADVKNEYVPDLLQQEVLDYIEHTHDQPFFLYYALNIPHANNEGGDEGMEVPDYGIYAEKNWPDQEKGFAVMMDRIDRYVDEILGKLKSLGMDEQTLVIFTSDNGPHEEGGHLADFFDSNGPLRGKKRDLYEGGIRVPMIAWWPDKIKAGSESDHIGGFQDMLPTFAELAGVTSPEGIDGISMLPVLLGKSGQKRHDCLYWEFRFRGQFMQAIRFGDWKGVRKNKKTLELFNLKTDIGEQTNLADRHPEIVSRIERMMEDAHQQA